MGNATTLTPPHEEIRLLEALLPAWHEGIQNLQDLAERFSLGGWKDRFLFLEQQQARCATELEIKIQELGGRGPSEPAFVNPPTPADPEDEPGDPVSLDKAMLLRFINGQTHLLHLLREVRRHPFAFDIRMILQRHHLQSQEVFDRISIIYLAYPLRLLQVA